MHLKFPKLRYLLYYHRMVKWLKCLFDCDEINKDFDGVFLSFSVFLSILY